MPVVPGKGNIVIAAVLFLAFADDGVHPNAVPDVELRDFLLQLLGLNFFDDLGHGAGRLRVGKGAGLIAESVPDATT